MGRNHRFAVVLGLIEEVAMAGESTEPIERRVAPLAKSVLFILEETRKIFYEEGARFNCLEARRID